MAFFPPLGFPKLLGATYPVILLRVRGGGQVSNGREKKPRQHLRLRAEQSRNSVEIDADSGGWLEDEDEEVKLPPPGSYFYFTLSAKPTPPLRGTEGGNRAKI